MNETAQKILGYIKRLPETWDGQPLRQQALYNFFKHPILFEANVDISSFIPFAFTWGESYEGAKYWSDISKKIEDSTIQLLPDEKKDEFENCNTWSNETKVEFFDYALKNISAFKDIGEAVEQFKASKQRKPLFVTEDGVGVFDEGLDVFRVESNFNIKPAILGKFSSPLKQYKYFSTEAAALEYVRLNKPMYSLGLILDCCSNIDMSTHTQIALITELEKLNP